VLNVWKRLVGIRCAGKDEQAKYNGKGFEKRSHESFDGFLSQVEGFTTTANDSG
jgi:hypothetical protein